MSAGLGRGIGLAIYRGAFGEAYSCFRSIGISLARAWKHFDERWYCLFYCGTFNVY